MARAFRPPAPSLAAAASPTAGLAFANTVAWHASARPRESLHRYADLVAWCRRAGVLDAGRAAALAREAGRRPAAAAAALNRALAVREAIYRIVVAQLGGGAAAPGDLDRLNRALVSARRHARLVALSGGLAWAWDDRAGALDAPLWRIVESGAALLTSGQRGRIGQCADDRGCGWLFLDTTRNHSRRWCDMGDCGNRAKARRYYRRTRGRRAGREVAR